MDVLKIGETIDRYRIEALVGRGGMAAVYKARHVQLDSEHAIKVLFVGSPAVRRRLLREGKVQANLRHPNIVSVTDVLEVLGAPALVMEYVAGPSLDAWLAEHRPTLDQSLWLFRGILKGIGAAHARGVIHRDLKPANVLLAPVQGDLMPKVTDFGLVKSIVAQGDHTLTGMTLGTPEYMGPEQIRDARHVDQRADMWALGCILYELVCGVRAFSAADRRSVFDRIVAGDYVPAPDRVAGLPPFVADAIDGLLAVDVADRLSSAEALRSLLYRDGTPPGHIAAPRTPARPILVDETQLEPPPAPTPFDPIRTATALGRAPTAQPAARRVVRHPPSARATAEFPALPRRRARLWPAALAGAGGTLAVALLVLAGLWIAGVLSVARPAAPPPPGRVQVIGDAPDVWLTSASSGRRFSPAAGLAPGRYAITARVGLEEIRGGTVWIAADSLVTIQCTPQRCWAP